MVKRYRSGWWLEIKYHDEGMTQQEIAEECGVSSTTIRKRMKQFGIPTRTIAGENHPLHGQSRSEETRRKIAESLDGRDVDDETRDRMAQAHTGMNLPQETREKISESLQGRTLSEATREKMSRATAGEQNPNWRGGYSRRYGPGWAVARSQVRERDEVCQHCGHDRTERRLEVHHIIPVRRFREAETASIEDAHDTRNLVLLCKRCHPRADHGHIVFESGLEPPE